MKLTTGWGSVDVFVAGLETIEDWFTTYSSNLQSATKKVGWETWPSFTDLRFLSNLNIHGFLLLVPNKPIEQLVAQLFCRILANPTEQISSHLLCGILALLLWDNATNQLSSQLQQVVHHAPLYCTLIKTFGFAQQCFVKVFFATLVSSLLPLLILVCFSPVCSKSDCPSWLRRMWFSCIEHWKHCHMRIGFKLPPSVKLHKTFDSWLVP